MARQEHPKENLLREASGLPDRVELSLDNGDRHVVIGFRSEMAASCYFGEEPAYHWNHAGQLRRAYVDGQLIKAQRGQLVALRRHRSDDQVQLLSHELTADELAAFLDRLEQRLHQLQTAIDTGNLRVIGQVSRAGGDVLAMVGRWLAQLPRPLSIAATPRVG